MPSGLKATQVIGPWWRTASVSGADEGAARSRLRQQVVEVDDPADAVTVAGQDQVGGGLRAGAGQGQDGRVFVERRQLRVLRPRLGDRGVPERTSPSSLPVTISRRPSAPGRPLTATHVTSAWLQNSWASGRTMCVGWTIAVMPLERPCASCTPASPSARSLRGF